MVAGLALQAVGLAWIAIVSEPSTPFVELIAPFVITGTGMSLIFPTAAATVLASVRPEQAGKASGANNAIREIGGVMGVAVLASVFAANGGYESPQAFTDGVTAALPVAVVVLAIGAVLALLVPRGFGLEPEAAESGEADGPAAQSAGRGEDAREPPPGGRASLTSRARTSRVRRYRHQRGPFGNLGASFHPRAIGKSGRVGQTSEKGLTNGPSIRTLFRPSTAGVQVADPVVAPARRIA